jgi:hypothetical protein
MMWTFTVTTPSVWTVVFRQADSTPILAASDINNETPIYSAEHSVASSACQRSQVTVKHHAA